MAKEKTITLPCSVGDSVWSLLTNGNKRFVTRFIIDDIEYKQRNNGYEICTFFGTSDGSDGMYHPLYFYWDKYEHDGYDDVLNQNVFLTEEEAIAYKEKLDA